MATIRTNRLVTTSTVPGLTPKYSYKSPKVNSTDTVADESQISHDDVLGQYMMTSDSSLPDEIAYGMSVDDSIIYIDGHIENSTAHLVIAKIRHIYNTRPEENANDPITLIINSPGGDVYSTFAIIDYIENLPVPVDTICRGQAASGGAMLLAAGTGIRRVSKRASVMLHHASMSDANFVSSTTMTNTAKHFETLNAEIDMFLASKTDKLSEFWKEYLDHDRYFTAQQALEFGLVDEII